eukprot:TRINITY_DN1747_c0_g1_i2.p1 TRINITY_DN1747_c0_g1~~TRINITY_DN1747_c0_g1_i2.p1  ORF type:complete len:1469 (+),score=315.49 TRINITY_DN1747_c0_g1_i2:45-4451(+)
MSLRAGDVLLSPEVVGHIVTWLPVKDVKVCELTCKQSNVVRGQHGAWGELLSRDEALVGESSWYSKNVLVPHDAYLYRRTGKVPPMWWAHTIASTAGVFWRNLTHTTLLTRLFWRQTNPYAPGTPSLSDNPRNLRRMTLTQKISGVPLLLIALPFILLYNVGVTLSKHLKSAADGLCSKAKTLHTSATTTYHKACTAVMARYQAYAAEPSIRFKTAAARYFRLLKAKLASICDNIKVRVRKVKDRGLEAFQEYVKSPLQRGMSHVRKTGAACQAKNKALFGVVRSAVRNYHQTYIGRPCARFSAAVTRMKVKLVSVCDAIKARVSRVKDKGLETFQKYVKIPLQRGMSRVGKVRAACQAKSEAEFGVVKANLKVLGKILMRLKKKAAVKFSAVWHVVKVIGGKCLVVLEKTERVVNHVAGAVVWELRNKKVIMFVRIQETCEQTRESARKLKRRSYLWYYNEQALCIEEAVHLEHYNLGHIGGLLKVSLKGTYAQLKGLDMGVMPNGPLPVIVFDRSASMGLWCHAALKNALPQAFSELGYAPSQRVIVLAFNSALEVYDTRLSQLANLNITAQGGTCIFDALQYLTRIIANHDDLKTPLNVLVVSDGQVADKDRAVAYTRDTVSANCDRSVNVGLLRIKTRDDDNPDTRAMACIGAFSTTGRTGVIDVDLRDELPGSEHGVALVRRAVVGSLKHSSAMSTTLTVDGGAAPLPSVNAQKTITVSTAHASYVYVAQSSMTEATVGGIVCSVQEMGRPHTEEVLHGSLECLENQLKIWQVVGICDDRTIVNEVQQRIVKWLMALKQIMYETPAEELRVSTRDRVKKLLTEYEKRKKSVCVRLLQMSTADCVSALNSAQQADYLRTSVTKQTKKLACRAKHKDEELGFDDLCKRVVSNVLALEFPEEDRAEDVSFYSQTSMCEVLQAVEEVVHVADDILSDDLLKIVGGLGVPYCAHVAEYPDPWRYRITEMYTGMLINESDLWTAHRQGGGVPLECPGRQGSLITGVIPLNKGKAMEFYNRKMTDLAELQAAVCMRRKMARVSGDIIAREAAGVLYCVEQMGIAGARHTNELEVTADLMNSMAHKLHHSTALTDLTLRLRSAADIRTLLIGINDISGILKPAMCLIRGCIERSRPQDRMTAAHSRALYEFGSYHAAREAFHGLASREQELHRVLDINFYAENELRVDHLKQYVGQLQWVPNMEHVAALFRAARLPPLVTPDRLVSLPSVTLHETFGFEEGFDMDTYKAGVVVMSLMSAKEQDRVKDNVCLTPQFTDMADVWRYLTDVRSKIFKKHKDEAERRLIETLRNKASNAKLIEMVKCSVASFAELLQTDAKREELPRLLRMLAGKNANVVAHGVQKLHILLTGVDSEGKAYGITPCRHIMKHKNSAVRLASKEYWEDLLKTHSVQIMKGYRYRQDTPNRHSHGNDKMSFWALGYPSLDVMQELNPAGYKEYVTAHTDCCGFRRRS